MLDETSDFDIAIPYQEFSELQSKLKISQQKCLQLSSQLAQRKENQTRQGQEIKQLKLRIKTLSKFCIQHSKKRMNDQCQNRRLEQQLQNLRNLIPNLQGKIMKESAQSLRYKQQIMELSQSLNAANTTIATLSNSLRAKQQENSQLSIENQRKQRALYEFERKSRKLSERIQQLQIKERILVDDDIADCIELRQSIKVLNNQNAQLKAQNEALTQKIDRYLNVKSETNKNGQNPEKIMLTNYATCLQIFKEKILSSFQDEDYLIQMYFKNRSIQLQLQRIYDQILSNK